MIESTERFTVNNADIGEMSDRIGRFLTRQGLEEREIKRLRLTMERLLRRVSERLGWGTPCELTLGRRLGRAYVQASYPGRAFDPTVIGRESAGNAWSARLLAELGLIPEWSFRGGINHLTLCPHGRERRMWLDVLAAAAFAAALSFVFGALPEGWTEAADRLVLAPLSGLFAAAAGVAVELTVFFRAASYAYGVGSAASLEKPGKLPVLRFAGLTCLWAALGTAVTALLYAPLAVPEGTWMERLSHFLTDLAPRDPVSPFLSGSFIQLAVLASAWGGMLLLLGGRAGAVREWTEQCDGLFFVLTERLCRASPAITGVLLLRALLHDSAEQFARAWKPAAVFGLSALVIVALKLLVTAARLGVGVPRLLKRLLPPARYAFRTASGAAAFGRTMDVCENDLGISHELVLTALPTGGVLCVPVASLCCPAALLFLMQGAELPTGLDVLAAIALSGVVLAATLPRTSGVLPVCFLLLSSRLGVPEEGLAAAALLGSALEPFAAALTSVYLPLELLTQAKLLGERDAEAWKR